jgi:hypothetical protein
MSSKDEKCRRDKPLKIKEPSWGSFILLAVATILLEKLASFPPCHLTDDNRDLYSEEQADQM